MLEDVAPNTGADRSGLSSLGDSLKQAEIRFPGAAGNHYRHGDGVDDLAELLGRSWPIALHDVGPELDAQPGAALQVRQTPFRVGVVVALSVVGIGVFGLGDEGQTK